MTQLKRKKEVIRNKEVVTEVVTDKAKEDMKVTVEEEKEIEIEITVKTDIEMKEVGSNIDTKDKEIDQVIDKEKKELVIVVTEELLVKKVRENIENRYNIQ